MDMELITILRSVFTVLVFATFIGIWIWAWSGKRKRDFEDAANLPFADGDIAAQTNEKDMHHE